MTYKQKGQSKLLLQAAQQVQDLCLDRYVQGTDWLITDDKLRIQRKCLGYSDTLPLSSRKLVRISSKDTSWQPYHIEQVQDILFHTGFR